MRKDGPVEKLKSGLERVFGLMLNFGDLEKIKWTAKGLKELPEPTLGVIKLVFEFCGDVRGKGQVISKRTLHDDFVRMHAGGKKAAKGTEYRQIFSLSLDGHVVHQIEGKARSKRQELGLEVKIDLFSDDIFQIIERPDKMIINGVRVNYEKPKYFVYRGIYEWFADSSDVIGDDLKNLIETWTTEDSIVDAIAEYVGNGDWIRFTTKEVLEISAPDGRTKEATDTWLLVHGLDNILDRDCNLKEHKDEWESRLDLESGQLRFRRTGSKGKPSRGMLSFAGTKHRIYMQFGNELVS